jgi:hypothetical protein
VFIESLRYHGFHLRHSKRNLKHRKGYVFPSTKTEDAAGIDLWIKMPKDTSILPIQVTQRGVRMYKKYHGHSVHDLEKFIEKSTHRIRHKQKRCHKNQIVFALVRDYDGTTTNPTIAWGDIKSLKHGIAYLRRYL